jgi:ABC-type nitrate/sulfonate/bicarbonate transport system substrate-binding protein
VSDDALASPNPTLTPALTDALIAGLANGKTDYKLVGRYISSPLRWAIITGKDSKYTEIDQLKGTTFGISRLGSYVCWCGVKS